MKLSNLIEKIKRNMANRGYESKRKYLIEGGQ